jgi:CRISPR-associated protein Cas2
MWVMVFFDLPVDTPEMRHVYTDFRKKLQKDGFRMFQFSIYVRHCSSAENADVHVERVKRWLPEKGQVGIMKITDKQFGMIQLFQGVKRTRVPDGGQQLMLF